MPVGDTSAHRVGIDNDISVQPVRITDHPPSPDACNDSLFSLLGMPCLTNMVEDFLSGASRNVPEDTMSVDELLWQVEEQSDLPAVTVEQTAQDEDRVQINTTYDSGAIATMSEEKERSNTSAVRDGDFSVESPAVSGIVNHASPESTGWWNAMWQRLLNCGLPGFLDSKNCSISHGGGSVAMIAAAAAPSTTGESLACRGGGDIIVYSKDFSDMGDDLERPARARLFRCFGPRYVGRTIQWVPNVDAGLALNFKQFQVLTPQDACKLFVNQNRAQCTVVYYAVVPDLSKSLADVEDPNRIPSKLMSRPCNPHVVAQGQYAQFGGCVEAGKQIRAQAGQILKSQQSSKPYSGVSINPPAADKSILQSYQSWGSPVPTLGGGASPSSAVTVPKYYGVKFNWTW